MRILIVEDDSTLCGLLLEQLRAAWQPVVSATAEPLKVVAADNLDDAVAALWSGEKVAAILTDGKFPAWPRSQMVAWNEPREHWLELAGWAQKLGIPLVVFSGELEIINRARASGYEAFEKPYGGQQAIERLIQLALGPSRRAGSPSGNPAVNDTDRANERLGKQAKEDEEDDR